MNDDEFKNVFSIQVLDTVESGEAWFQQNEKALLGYIYLQRDNPRQTLRALVKVKEHCTQHQFDKAVDHAKVVKTYNNTVLTQLKKVQEDHLLAMNEINNLLQKN